MPSTRFRNIGWTVGSHCDAACDHCYSLPVRGASAASLHREELARIVGRLTGIGVASVNLGGNEPAFTHGPELADSQLPWLIEALTRAGMTVGLTSNGTTVRFLLEQHPAQLARLHDIDFSLDFPHQEAHDAQRGSALFQGVIEGLQRCRALGIPCAITACATRESFTASVLEDYLDLCFLLDCELRINLLQPVVPRLLDRMPSPLSWYEGFALLLDRCDCLTLGDACLAALYGQPVHGCPCGERSFRIHGKNQRDRVPISPCVYAHDFATGDLLSQQAGTIAAREPFAAFARRRERVPAACRAEDCPWLERCRGGCASRAWLVHGDLEARDPYCPLTLQREHGPLPLSTLTMAEDAGQRVHDGYLCTWIGRVRPDHRPRHARLEAFLSG
jgi:radical SAM protein with 4Fe4S-binding SPASM domain